MELDEEVQEDIDLEDIDLVFKDFVLNLPVVHENGGKVSGAQDKLLMTELDPSDSGFVNQKKPLSDTSKTLLTIRFNTGQTEHVYPSIPTDKARAQSMRGKGSV